MKTENLLKQSFPVDSMYCLSVNPWMARFASFGEFVGYPIKQYDPPFTAHFPRRSVHQKPIPNGAIDYLVRMTFQLSALFLHLRVFLFTQDMIMAKSLHEDSEDSVDDEKNYFRFRNGVKIERHYLSPARFVDKLGLSILVYLCIVV